MAAGLIDVGIPYFSAVMKKNLDQLPELLKLLIDNNVKTWEVFFLIQTGRAIDSEDLTPDC